MTNHNRTLSVRWQQVEFERTGSIPVLVSCDRNRADGYLLPAKRNQPVRAVDESLLQLIKGTRNSDRELTGMMLLMEALKERNATVLDFAERYLEPEPRMRKMFARFAESNPVGLLGKLLPDGVKNVEFVAWQDMRDDEYISLQPGLFCPDERSALYVLTLLYGESGHGACLQCGKLLSRERSTKLYCDAKCRAKWHRKHPKCKAKKSSRRNRRH